MFPVKYELNFEHCSFELEASYITLVANMDGAGDGLFQMANPNG
jgi:hypothetical protein